MKISQSVNNANACYGLHMNIANAGAGLEYAFRFSSRFSKNIRFPSAALRDESAVRIDLISS